jgi:hypothetical protein
MGTLLLLEVLRPDVRTSPQKSTSPWWYCAQGSCQQPATLNVATPFFMQHDERGNVAKLLRVAQFDFVANLENAPLARVDHFAVNKSTVGAIVHKPAA